jgi:deoxyadenosine/deoxycytidine kinase
MLIVIEGCVGAGKSTVAKGLAEYRKSNPLLEAFEGNPFLTTFYENPLAHAVETEFAFLLLHFHQLKNHNETISNQELIADFHLGKDLLYADLNLKDAKMLQVFKQLYELLAKRVPKPAFLVYLSANSRLLTKRIRQRKRDFELRVDPAYYAKLNARYEKFFEQYDGPKLKIFMDKWDFVQTPSLYQKLSLLIDEQTKPK